MKKQGDSPRLTETGGILSVKRWTWRCQPQSLFKWFTGFSFALTFPLSCIILLFISLSLSRSQRMRLPVIRSFICVFTARNAPPTPPPRPAPPLSFSSSLLPILPSPKETLVEILIWYSTLKKLYQRSKHLIFIVLVVHCRVQLNATFVMQCHATRFN